MLRLRLCLLLLSVFLSTSLLMSCTDASAVVSPLHYSRAALSRRPQCVFTSITPRGGDIIFRTRRRRENGIIIGASAITVLFPAIAFPILRLTATLVLVCVAINIIQGRGMVIWR